MILWYFHPYGGAPGTGKYLRPYHLAVEWQRQGHEVVCFVSRYHHLLDSDEPLPPEQIIDGVRFVSLPARSYRGNGLARAVNMLQFCAAMFRLPRHLPRPDAVIVSSPHPFAIFPGWWLARVKHKARLAFEVRDIWPLSITEMTATPAWHPITLGAWLAERFAYRTADVLASLLGNAEPYMRGRGLRGRFVHVPNGISEGIEPSPPSTDAGKKAAATIATWHEQGRTVIIHPGTQGQPSALDVLLRAVSTIPPSIRPAVLLVGGGDTSDTLRTLATELGLGDDVAFFPPVPRSEANWLVHRSDIGYAGKRNFRTVFQHGISFNKINDFMEAGLPVILPVTTRGDPVSASGCGIVTGDDAAEIAKGLVELVQMSPAARREMGERGRRFAMEHLSYSAIARRYIDAIAADE